MHSLNLKFVAINQHNLNVFNNLSQAYEAEFSNLTHKMPDEHGLFKIDTTPHPPYVGYLLYSQTIPIGFCVADIESEIKDVAEFYIIPLMRKKNLGYQLAVMLFNSHPGQWQVRQIEGATESIHFWRSIIKKYTHDHYEESVVRDAHWGTVTRQRFQTTSSSST